MQLPAVEVKVLDTKEVPRVANRIFHKIVDAKIKFDIEELTLLTNLLYSCGATSYNTSSNPQYDDH